MTRHGYQSRAEVERFRDRSLLYGREKILREPRDLTIKGWEKIRGYDHGEFTESFSVHGEFTESFSIHGKSVDPRISGSPEFHPKLC